MPLFEHEDTEAFLSQMALEFITVTGMFAIVFGLLFLLSAMQELPLP